MKCEFLSLENLKAGTGTGSKQSVLPLGLPTASLVATGTCAAPRRTYRVHIEPHKGSSRQAELGVTSWIDTMTETKTYFRAYKIASTFVSWMHSQKSQQIIHTCS